MKAGVAMCAEAQGKPRKLVAGIHDTDYFAKHPGAKKSGGYRALPHNDTTTRDLWSAAGEFSALFGSESVITRDELQRAGAKLGKIQRERPGMLDAVTEAYGWRGVAFLGDTQRIIAETPFAPLRETLLETLDWAIDESLGRVASCAFEGARARAEQLRTLACNASELPPDASLSDFYREILPQLYRFIAGQDLDLDVTATTELLRFNRETANRPRFALVDLFLRPETRVRAIEAYNAALRGTEIYTLDRFGSWALPFDVVVPGHGRGTLRVAPKAIIIMTPKPLFITLKRPVTNVMELAEAIERKFGNRCTLVGKAVSLIGMLATEHVFVFHEGASGYVAHSRRFHQLLGEVAPKLHPILRVKYATWDAFADCHIWLNLPEPLVQPFGAEELSSKSFAARWRMAAAEQERLLEEISRLRRPIDFVRFLAQRFSASWSGLAERYEAMHDQLQTLHQEIEAIRQRKTIALAALREAKAERQRLQTEMGLHWRAELFEKNATPDALQQRESYREAIRAADQKIRQAQEAWRELQREQDGLVQSESVQTAHEQRRDLELELEIKRAKLVRQAITTVKGLKKAGYRPSAWWFPLLCPDGGWFRSTTYRAEYYLEPLQ